MHKMPRCVARCVFVALVAAGLALAVRMWGHSGTGSHELVPTIGGDTWPPVPVKQFGQD